jgi:polysaccharide export outer membrane protein
VFAKAIKLLIVLTFAMLVGCASSQATTDRQAPIPDEDTTLGPGDVFEVRVYGQKDLSGKHRIAPDGTINFPFLGPVQAGGRDPQALAEAISEGLKSGGYLSDPQVTVFLEESNSKRVSVLGAVAKPGTFPMIAGMTVIQAVSQAGGFTPIASKNDTVVTRRVEGKIERYRVRVSEITRGGEEDFPLRAGDIVFVPERVF